MNDKDDNRISAIMNSHTISLNTPINYSKAPKQYYHHSTKMPSLTPTPEPISTSSFIQLDNLPTEILVLIIDNLSQFELVNLSQVNKKISRLCHEKLFRNIIVDANFNIFDSNEFRTHSVTYINSSYNFKKFVKLATTSEKKHAEIERFMCLNMPENVDLYSHEIHHDLKVMFSNFHKLKELVWIIDDGLDLEILDVLPNKDILETLILNIKSNVISNEFFEDLVFKNLKNLQIFPFYTSNYLSNIIDKIVVNCADLNMLGLTKFPSIIQAIPHRQQLTYEVEFLWIPKVFRKINKSTNLANLTVLSLNDVMVTYMDAKMLTKSVTLSNLTTLHLRGVTELTDTTVSDSFLLILAPQLTSLSHLSLDIEETKTEYLPDFLLELPSLLTSLDVKIRKREETPFDTYSHSITRHNGLIKLSVELSDQEDHSLNHIPSEFYKSLAKLTKLQSLRINSSSLSDTSSGLLYLLSQLPQLTFLDVFGKQAGGMPILGLDMIHPTIFDDWFKVQHVVFIFLENNHTLKYVRINSCLFVCDYSKMIVNPNDGLNMWFDRNVKIITF